MSKCPRCTILVKFPDDHDGRWYQCPNTDCNAYIRELSLKISGITRVDLGKPTATGIVPVPANEVIVKPATYIPTTPKNVKPIRQPIPQNQARTNSPTSAQNASLGSSSNSSQAASAERKPLSLDQIREGRKQVTDEFAILEELYKNLLKDLKQEYINNPKLISFIAEQLQETEENRQKLISRLQALNSLEVTNLSNKIRELNSKLESRTISQPPSYITKSNESIHFGYSAFLGIGAMIWFTLSMGIQQWEFKTLMMMVGIGVGIAFVGWITGRGW